MIVSILAILAIVMFTGSKEIEKMLYWNLWIALLAFI